MLFLCSSFFGVIKETIYAAFHKKKNYESSLKNYFLTSAFLWFLHETLNGITEVLKYHLRPFLSFFQMCENSSRKEFQMSRNGIERKKRPCNLNLDYISDSELHAYSYKSSLSPRFEGSEMATFDEGRRTSLPGKPKGRAVTKSIILRPEELFTKYNFDLKMSERKNELPPLLECPGHGDSEIYPSLRPRQISYEDRNNNNSILNGKLSLESILEEPKSPRSPRDVNCPLESPRKDFVKAQASKRLEDRFTEWISKEGTLDTLATDVLEIIKGGGEEIIKKLTDENSVLEKAKARATSSMKSLTPNRYRPPLSPAPDFFGFFRKRDRSSSPEKSTSAGSIPPISPCLVQTPPLEREQPHQTGTIFQLNIPRFHWPQGKPLEDLVVREKTEELKRILDVYAGGSYGKEFPLLLKALDIPLYWKKPFWEALKFNKEIDKKAFFDFYSKLLLECRDEESKFLRIFAYKRAKNQLVSNLKLIPEDFKAFGEDLISSHPGLEFLTEAPEFHERYINTIVSRIFYQVNRAWNGEINLLELRKSNLMDVIRKLSEVDDINLIHDYFSYEHFYVIYCKFWELDKNRDEFITLQDLIPYGGQVLSHIILKRIFSGAVHRSQDIYGTKHCKGAMSYTDFVWFIISEEDKKSRTAIEYWFRCLDLDGDGVLSAYELELFYSEQRVRLEDEGVQSLEFDNIYCQAVDQLGSSTLGITLRDLKKNPTMASILFNTMFNFEKYLEQEQRDPFVTHVNDGTNRDDHPITDWERYAAQEYEYLIAEESPSSTSYEQFEYDDPYNSAYVELAIEKELGGTIPVMPIIQAVPIQSENYFSYNYNNNQPTANAQKSKKKK